MKMTPLFGGVLLLAACGGLVLTHGAVIELDDNSFYNYAKDRDVLLVDFYAPWCSDCKNLEPDFQAAGVSLGARSIDLAKVDCFGAGKGLCTKYGVKQWPTLKNFNRGTYTGDYTGGLSSGEIAGYVNTVENSVSSQVISNPYAAPYTPMVMQTQQCVSRCKISKITNKAPCYAKCKAPKPAVRKMLPQPVINEKSCAKCRQPQIAGKFSSRCITTPKRAHSRRNDVTHNKGDSGMPKHKERQLMDTYMHKVLKDYVTATLKPKGYSGLPNVMERKIMDEYMMHHMLKPVLKFASKKTGKLRDFLTEVKNVKGPTVGNAYHKPDQHLMLRHHVHSHTKPKSSSETADMKEISDHVRSYAKTNYSEFEFTDE